MTWARKNITGSKARCASSCSICSSGTSSPTGAAGHGVLPFWNIGGGFIGSFEEDPGLKSQLDEALEAAYEDARLEAASETGLSLSLFPVRRPFEYAEIMERSIVWPGDED